MNINPWALFGLLFLAALLGTIIGFIKGVSL